MHAKDFRNLLKSTWTKRHILKILGQNTYSVQINKTNLIWKRHQNQLILWDISNIDDTNYEQTERLRDSLKDNVSENDLTANVEGITDKGEIINEDIVSEPSISSHESSSKYPKPKRARKSPDRLRC